MSIRTSEDKCFCGHSRNLHMPRCAKCLCGLFQDMTQEPSGQDDTILSSEQLDRLNGEKLKQTAPHPTDDELDDIYESAINRITSAAIRGDIEAVNRYAAEAKQRLEALLSERERLARIDELRTLNNVEVHSAQDDDFSDGYRAGFESFARNVDERIATLEASKPEEKQNKGVL